MMETSLLQELTPSLLAQHEPVPVRYLHLSDRTIAYRHLEGKSPTLIYVGGFLSTMEIHKAAAVEQYAKNHGRASIRYDQASTGMSSGIDRKNATNEVWIQDLEAMMDIVAEKGPVVLVASSNGAQVSGYIAAARPEAVKGLVWIGPSIESGFTKLKASLEGGLLDEEFLRKFNSNEYLSFETPYGKGYFTKESFLRGQKYALDLSKPISIQCPVKILHCYVDEEVPWEKSKQFIEQILSTDADLILRKTGNHRLMKPRDLTLLQYTIHCLLNEIENLKRSQL